MQRKNNKRFYMWQIFCLFFSVIILFLISIFVCSPQVRAATLNQVGLLSSRSDVIKYNNNFFPNLTQYPFNSQGVSSIAFDHLYGTGNLTHYTGEIPGDWGNSDDVKFLNSDQCSGYPTTGTMHFAGYYRNWVDGNPAIKIGNEFNKTCDDTINKAANLNTATTDMHIYALTFTEGWGIAWLISSILDALGWLIGLLISVVIFLKNIDFGGILTAIDSSGSLTNTLTQLLSYNAKTGLSPLLLIALIVFICCLLVLTAKSVTGKNGSFKNIVAEIGYFIIAMAIAGMFIAGTTGASLGSMAIGISDKLAQSVASSATPGGNLFVTKTAVTADDDISNANSSLNQTQVEQVIQAQFGYPVNQLNVHTIPGDINSPSDFGDTASVNKALKTTFQLACPQCGNSFALSSPQNAFMVSVNNTAKPEDNGQDNLGYFWIAGQTSVAIRNGVNRGPVFHQNKTGVSVDHDSAQRALFMVDFLNNLYHEDITAKNQTDALKAQESKIATIVMRLNTPDRNGYMFQSLLLLIQRIFFLFASIMILLFLLVSMCILLFAGYGAIILPVTLLIKQTREMSRMILFTFLFAFLRVIVGNAMWAILFTMLVLLDGQGTMGIILSIPIFGFLAKFAPKIIAAINAQISKVSKGRELGFVTKGNTMLDTVTNKASKHIPTPDAITKKIAQNKGEKRKVMDDISAKYLQNVDAKKLDAMNKLNSDIKNEQIGNSNPATDMEAIAPILHSTNNETQKGIGDIGNETNNTGVSARNDNMSFTDNGQINKVPTGEMNENKILTGDETDNDIPQAGSIPLTVTAYDKNGNELDRNSANFAAMDKYDINGNLLPKDINLPPLKYITGVTQEGMPNDSQMVDSENSLDNLSQDKEETQENALDDLPQEGDKLPLDNVQEITKEQQKLNKYNNKNVDSNGEIITHDEKMLLKRVHNAVNIENSRRAAQGEPLLNVSNDWSLAGMREDPIKAKLFNDIKARVITADQTSSNNNKGVTQHFSNFMSHKVTTARNLVAKPIHQELKEKRNNNIANNVIPKAIMHQAERVTTAKTTGHHFRLNANHQVPNNNILLGGGHEESVKKPTNENNKKVIKLTIQKDSKNVAEQPVQHKENKENT